MHAKGNLKIKNIDGKNTQTHERELAIPDHIILYILNYLNAKSILNAGLASSRFHKNIIAYLRINSNNLLNLAEQEDLNKLNNLSKINNIGIINHDRETRKKLKFKYKKIKTDKLPLIRLAIRNNSPISYDNILKAIKIASVTHPCKSIYDH